MKKCIGHLAFNVADMKKSIEYYCNGLGFEHAFSLPNPQTGEPWIEYLHLGGGQFIELFYTKPGFVNNNNGYTHLCLEVEDCVAAVKEFEARGVNITSQPKQGSDFNIQAWTADPDGNRIEIMQISPESPQAKWR
ncbi:MAG: VOC family protein [Eubacteriales bacterium]|nr:VOC family protein [Eubacteriales bacterium]